jgi:hypothetical protein
MPPVKKKAVSTRVSEYCGNCRFFMEQEDVGICRRYPPAILNDGDAAFTVHPIVDATEWCGEHQLGGKQ